MNVVIAFCATLCGLMWASRLLRWRLMSWLDRSVALFFVAAMLSIYIYAYVADRA